MASATTCVQNSTPTSGLPFRGGPCSRGSTGCPCMSSYSRSLNKRPYEWCPCGPENSARRAARTPPAATVTISGDGWSMPFPPAFAGTFLFLHYSLPVTLPHHRAPQQQSHLHFPRGLCAPTLCPRSPPASPPAPSPFSRDSPSFRLLPGGSLASPAALQERLLLQALQAVTRTRAPEQRLPGSHGRKCRLLTGLAWPSDSAPRRTPCATRKGDAAPARCLDPLTEGALHTGPEWKFPSRRGRQVPGTLLARHAALKHEGQKPPRPFQARPTAPRPQEGWRAWPTTAHLIRPGEAALTARGHSCGRGRGLSGPGWRSEGRGSVRPAVSLPRDL